MNVVTSAVATKPPHEKYRVSFSAAVARRAIPLLT